MKIVRSLASDDGRSIKFLQKTKDNHIIETGYYDLDKHILCITTQIGCAMGCIFCATTAPVDAVHPGKRFIRNLTADEIVGQVRNVLRTIKPSQLRVKEILFSYMGMGEPFLNYKNVVSAIKTLSQEFFNSRTTISTTGIRPDLIKKLAHEPIDTVLKLHVSLHAPDDRLRKKILPKAKTINESLEALKYFTQERGTPAKVNYVLIKNLNDSPKQAAKLAELLKNYPFKAKFSNLNEFNNLKAVTIDKFYEFDQVLKVNGIKTCMYFSAATDVKAGCGQLRRHYYGK